MGMAFGGVNGEFYATTFSHSSPQVEGGHGRVAGVAPGPVVGRRAVTPAIGVTAGAGRARAAVAAAEVLTERGDPGESGHIFQPKQCSLRVLGVKRKRVPWEAFLPSIASSRPCIIHQVLCSSLSLSLCVSLSTKLSPFIQIRLCLFVTQLPPISRLSSPPRTPQRTQGPPRNVLGPPGRHLISAKFANPPSFNLIPDLTWKYRVTRQLGSYILLTSKQKFCHIIDSLYSGRR